MENMRVFSYTDDGQKTLRMVMVDGKPWWAACDIRKILGLADCTRIHLLMSEDSWGYAWFSASNKYPAFCREYVLVNEKGLRKLFHRYEILPSCKKFKQWLEKEILPNLPQIKGFPADFIRKTRESRIKQKSNEPVETNLKTEVPVKSESPVDEKQNVLLVEPPHYNLQKAELLMRLAGQQGIPEADRIYLLDMAMRELTGDGLSISQPSRATIMDLPIVSGVALKRRFRDINGKHIALYPIMAISERTGLSPATISNYIKVHDLMHGSNGYWIPIQIQNSPAREFMFTQDAAAKYFNMAC